MDEQEKTAELRGICERIMSESKPVAYAIALHDYQDGFRFAINAERPFHAASTMKTPILLELLRRVDRGELTLEQELDVKNEFKSLVDGSPFSCAQCCTCRTPSC